jgi:hypothetical protein
VLLAALTSEFPQGHDPLQGRYRVLKGKVQKNFGKGERNAEPDNNV